MRIINATFEGVDEWSRVIIKTEGGTRLCDIACNDPEAMVTKEKLKGIAWIAELRNQAS